MRVKRIVFINRAPFGNLDLDFSDKQIITLTGINGAGKTTVLSYIVDAMYEIAKKIFTNEFSGIKEGKLYRISSNIYNMQGSNYSLVYISFDMNRKEINYLDLLGTITEDKFNELMSAVYINKNKTDWPIKFGDISNQIRNGSHYARFVNINKEEAKIAFSDNILTYFPSYRYEQPGYLNDVFRMELSYKYMSDINGFFTNPIEVTSDLPVLANWMMDIVLDRYLYGETELLQKLQNLISIILSNKYKKPVRIGIGHRNLGGARIQIVDFQTSAQIYPTIFNMSAGESSLLCLFGELLRQTDRLGKKIDDIEGIVLVDEVDKHLHIVLQKEVLPVLVQLFPKVQFIFTTHSAFINIGLMDVIKNRCSVLDLDNNGIECEANKNNVFREAYDAITKENDRYMDFYNELSEKVKEITKPIVYLEGRTDEKYFKKAIEVFGYKDIRIDFQWIGHLDTKGNEVFTGSGSLNQGMQFIKGRNPKILHFFIFDCDTNKQESDEGNIVVLTIPNFSDHTVMNRGIENALELNDIDLNDFYQQHTNYGDYGKVTITKEFDKMKLCDYICELDIDSQKKILANLKPIIEKIITRTENQDLAE